MQLNEIKDNEGARKARMRVGRGIGSGKGKTCGSGQKGQKSRSGVAIKGFEGGQQPLYQRLPKRGFTNYTRKSYSEINLATLQTAIDAKKIDAKKAITGEMLQEAGVITHLRDGVRLLGTGELKAKVDLTVAGASKTAVAAVEKAGGKITLLAVEASEKREKGKTKRAKAKA